MSNQIKVEVTAIDKTKWVIKSIQDDMKSLWWKLWGILKSWLWTAIWWIKTWLLTIWWAWVAWIWTLIADAMSANKWFRQLQNQIWATAEEMWVLKSSIKTVFAQWLWNSLEEVQSAFSVIKKETWETWKTLEKSVTNVLTVSNTFWSDFMKTFRAINAIQKDFWVSSEEASDMVMKWMQKSGDMADDFLDTIWEYRWNFKEAWYEAKEFLNFLITWTETWAYNFDVVWDTAREFFIKLKEWNSDQKAALAELWFNYEDLKSKINSWWITQKKVLELVAQWIWKVTKTTDQAIIATALFWTKSEDLWINFIKNLSKIDDKLWDTKWTVSTATENISNNFENTFRRLRMSLMQVWEAFLPYLDKLATWFESNKPLIDEWAKKVATFVAEFDFTQVISALNTMWDILKKIAEVVWFVWEKIWKVTWAVWTMSEKYNISSWFSWLFSWYWLKWFTDKWAAEIEESRAYKESIMSNTTNNSPTMNVTVNAQNTVIKDQWDEKRFINNVAEEIARKWQNFINWIN